MAAYTFHSYLQYFKFQLRLKTLIITNGILVLWIIINLADLQYLFVIHLVRVKLDLGNNTQSAFARKMAKINPVAVAKFLYIICNTVFMSLFAVGQFEKEFLEPISIYYITVKINGHGILYMHCLVWLRDISHPAMLCFQIQNNNIFCQKLLLFLEHIINCFTCQYLPGNITSCISRF